MNSISVPKMLVEVRDGRNLKTVPWRHQKNAIDFLRRVLHMPRPDPLGRRIEDGGGAMLAMGMGTGKSLLAVSMVCNLNIDSALIVCPYRVIEVWPEQFRRHADRDDLRIVALGEDCGSVAEKCQEATFHRNIARVTRERFIGIINYESLWRKPFADWALRQKWGLVVLDESHRIKQAGGKASMFCARLRDHAVYRLCLTGTPMPHSPLDTYAQYRFLDPTILGRSYHAFKTKYAIMGGFNQKQVVGFRNLEDMEALIGRITFTVGKEVLDLPPETRVTYHCTLSRGAQKVYCQIERETIAEIEAGIITAANAMVKLLRLQQITGGYIKTDAGDTVAVDAENAKAALLEDTLEDIAQDEPIVVFCRFRADLDTVHTIAERTGRASLELSGRRDELKRWQDGGAPLIAVQISAGGVGVDLTRARYSIYYSLGFSLGDYEQSLARVHRPGQTRPVTQIHLVARGTVDERVLRALERRAEVVGAVMAELKAISKGIAAR